MSNALEETRQQLAQLEAEAAAAERQRLITQLAQIRADLKEGRARYTKLANTIREQRQDRQNAQGAVDRANAAVTDSLRAKPRVYDLLPDDDECVAWKQRHVATVAKRDQLIRERDSLPDPEGKLLDEAIAYEGMQGILAQLEFAERNLLRRIEGGSETRVEGGISGVR